ncbi:MAG: hypothetical protein RLZZ86_331 [Cyanobacteriota bacterium]|jgi:hypothetical protein
MTYQLNRWVIYRVAIPNFLVARFRKRTDAEAYLRFLRRNNKSFKYEVMYDGN